jgi:hypothetical protein
MASLARWYTEALIMATSATPNCWRCPVSGTLIPATRRRGTGCTRGFAACRWKSNLKYAQEKGVATNRKAAAIFASNVLPIVREIQAAGATTHLAIAQALNARGIRTARGGVWHDSTVRNLLARTS